MRFRRLPRPVLLGATVLVIVAAVVLLLRRDDGDGGPTPDEVRAVELTALAADDDARLGDLLDGRPMVVNFFAEWCRPCRQEMPDFEALHRELGDEVRFVGVSLDHKRDEAEAMVAQTGVTYPTFFDPRGDVFAVFDGVQLPTTVFVDADGTVRGSHDKILDADGLRDRIAEDLGVAA
ncbi:MAG TPA: TlpA disulfide reductase family protein [Acidimicrobiales bacterium]